ncbi:extracellular solute-binding protein [Lacrimispora sphenoides]|uniref:Iron(III) transport system substrate-binding protein n=1 Tax=Lacrimispora sphenoides JCM 1415 TaxID=1297793 RepID=A0ABY1CFP7_9FIRM|nr:iron(III) transport system substrate-binding protein [[Clostridium] sphenoides JCM 1415]SUY53195.1 extracellular solute-binding protein [Lacrimispora sphenoides]
MMEETNMVFKRWFAHLLFLSVLASAVIMIYLINPLPNLKRSESGEKEELVVYSSERTEFMDCVLSLFEEKYNIPVKLVTGENEELITTLKDGKGMPSVDVLMGVSPLELYGNEALFQRYVSKNHQYISVSYQQENGFSTVYLLSGNCIVVNKTLARDIDITGYTDLLKPELAGRIAMSDPYYSMMGFSHMINILEITGGSNSETAWDFYKSLLEQSKVQLSAEEVYSGVAKGKYVAGLAYDEVCASLIKEGADIAIVYPVEGSLFMTKNAAILNDAPHLEYAELFIDFLISKDMQDIFGTVLTARPVRIVAQISGYLSSKDSIPSVLPDFESYSKSKTELKKRYRESLIEVSENE